MFKFCSGIMGHKVYISSVYAEFAKVRKKIHQYIHDRGQLYELTGMENYGAEDLRSLKKCIDDVCKTDIYVCIIGYSYGSLALGLDNQPTGLSFTHWEYNTACESKAANKKIERLIYIKKVEGKNDDHETLTQLKESILSSQSILCKFFTSDDELPSQILKDLDNYVAKLTKVSGFSSDEKYFCDRVDQSEGFEKIFYTKKKTSPIHFFLLSGRNKDSHLSFVEKYRCVFRAKNNNQETPEIICNIKVNPPNDEARIVERIKWMINQNISQSFGIDPLPEVNANHLFELLSQLKKDYLIINLFVQSTYLKDSFADIYEHSIEKFYNDFTAQQEEKYKDKKIIFFLHLTFPNNAENNLIYETTFDDNPFFSDNKLIPLNKINIDEIRDWLQGRHIEENPTKIDELLKNFFSDLCPTETEEFFMSDAEIRMEKIIFYYNTQNP